MGGTLPAVPAWPAFAFLPTPPHPTPPPPPPPLLGHPVPRLCTRATRYLAVGSPNGRPRGVARVAVRGAAAY